jgi:hypothetical protein
MAKEQLTGWLHEPLTAVFGTRAKIAALRILWRAATPLPYREVVRRSGMAYGSIDLALGELSAVGIVEELEGGRERRVQFRTGHRLAVAIGSLLQVEADYFVALRVELRTIADACRVDGLLSAAMTGVVARREERLDSETEVVVIARDAGSTVQCLARFDARADALAVRFGVKLKLIGYDVRHARAMWQTRTAAAVRVVKESELLAGEPLESVLTGDHGQTVP